MQTLKTITDKNGNTTVLEANLTVLTRKKQRYWIVYSPQFKTFGYSNKSEKLAFDDLDIALDIFFDVHKERGTLDKALIIYGWIKTGLMK